MADPPEPNPKPGSQPGRKLGDRRVKVSRPASPYFRYGERGTIVAKAAASRPESLGGRLAFGARRLLFGRVLSTAEELE